VFFFRATLHPRVSVCLIHLFGEAGHYAYGGWTSWNRMDNTKNVVHFYLEEINLRAYVGRRE